MRSALANQGPGNERPDLKRSRAAWGEAPSHLALRARQSVGTSRGAETTLGARDTADARVVPLGVLFLLQTVHEHLRLRESR